MKVSFVQVSALLVLGALATVSQALPNDEEAAADRRLQQEFGMRKFDPKKDYGPQGFLSQVPGKSGTKGRRLLLPLAFGGLLPSIQAGVKIFQTIVSFFGKTYTEQLVASHLDNGYSKFKTSSEAQTVAGVPHNNLPRFLELLARKFGMEGAEKDLFIEDNRWAAYTMGGKDWKDERYVFSVGKGGNARTAAVYINNDMNSMKVNVLFIISKTEFKLAPDVFVILCSTTRFWSTSHKIKYKKYPANIKAKDIEFVSNYGNLIAIQLLADMAGLTAPKDPNFKKYERDMLPEPEATSVRWVGDSVVASGGSAEQSQGWGVFAKLMRKYNKNTKQFDKVEAGTATVTAAPNGNPFNRPVYEPSRNPFDYGHDLSKLLSRKSLYRRDNAYGGLGEDDGNDW